MSTTTPSMDQQITAVKTEAAANLPAHIIETIGEHLSELVAAGVPATVAAVGTPVGDAPLLTATGEQTSLHAVTGDRPVALVFYRGEWCPYCNVALHVYGQQLLEPLRARGAELIAISPQAPDGSLTMQEKHGLAFPVVSDPGNRLAGELGVLMPARTDSVRAVQEELGLQLEQVNADGADTLPMATVAVLGPDHVLRWIDVRPDFTTRTEPADILAALDEIA